MYSYNSTIHTSSCAFGYFRLWYWKEIPRSEWKKIITVIFAFTVRFLLWSGSWWNSAQTVSLQAFNDHPYFFFGLFIKIHTENTGSIYTKYILTKVRHIFGESVQKFSFSTSQSSSLDLGCLWFLSLSRWSHTTSRIFRSGLCGDQSMTVSVLSAVFVDLGDLQPCVMAIQCLSVIMLWRCLLFAV